MAVDEDLLEVKDVHVFTVNAGMGVIVGMKLVLEDYRSFKMYHIPIEVALTIQYLREGGQQPRRKSVFDFLAYYEPFKEALANNLRRVVIDEMDENTGLYTASVEMEDDGFRSVVKMIPSHAVFLALLSGAPIYVHRRLVEAQEEVEEE